MAFPPTSISYPVRIASMQVLRMHITLIACILYALRNSLNKWCVQLLTEYMFSPAIKGKFNEGWIQAIGATFLEPFGLGDQ